jgi:hypothetical protein
VNVDCAADFFPDAIPGPEKFPQSADVIERFGFLNKAFALNSCWQDPPLLFRKERFLHAEHPLHEKSSRLTRQEEKRGLLDQIDDSAPASRW